jgi:DNA-binding beta-propeller fold protein YncE
MSSDNTGATYTAAAAAVPLLPAVPQVNVRLMSSTKSLNFDPATTVGVFRFQVYSAFMIMLTRLVMIVDDADLQAEADDAAPEAPDAPDAPDSASNPVETYGNFTILDDDARTLGSYGIVAGITINVIVRDRNLTELGTYVPLYEAGVQEEQEEQDVYDVQYEPYVPNDPYGICMSSNGLLFVAEKKDNCVQVIRISDGSLINTISMWGMMPNLLCLSPNEEHLYVSDFYGVVHIFETEDGVFVRTIGSEDNSAGQFDLPCGICISLNGEHMYVVDKCHRVQVMRVSDGACEMTIGSQGRDDGQLLCPTGVCMSPDGEFLFVSDSSNHRIQVFQTSDGQFVRSFGSYGNGPGQLIEPGNMCLTKDGEYLFVIDNLNYRVQVLRASDGEYVHGFDSRGQFEYPIGICLSPDEDFLFVTEKKNDRLHKFVAFW